MSLRVLAAWIAIVASVGCAVPAPRSGTPHASVGDPTATQHVTVEFTIAADGHVRNPRVTKSSDPAFDAAALRAVQEWKYNPKVVDGVAVERENVRVALEFEPE